MAAAHSGARFGATLALRPLSAMRALNVAALGVYRASRPDGAHRAPVDTMQTRAELCGDPGDRARGRRPAAIFAGGAA